MFLDKSILYLVINFLFNLCHQIFALLFHFILHSLFSFVLIRLIINEARFLIDFFQILIITNHTINFSFILRFFDHIIIFRHYIIVFFRQVHKVVYSVYFIQPHIFTIQIFLASNFQS